MSFDLYATQRRAGEQQECVVAFVVSAASRVALVSVARNTCKSFLKFVLLAYADLHAIQTSRKTARVYCIFAASASHGAVPRIIEFVFLVSIVDVYATLMSRDTARVCFYCCECVSLLLVLAHVLQCLRW